LQSSAARMSELAAGVRCRLWLGVDELTRATLIKPLLHEAQKSCATRQQLDRIDRHMAALRQLIYRQLELVEKDNSKRHNVERSKACSRPRSWRHLHSFRDATWQLYRGICFTIIVEAGFCVTATNVSQMGRPNGRATSRTERSTLDVASTSADHAIRGRFRRKSAIEFG
jgi:hypothetical protein